VAPEPVASLVQEAWTIGRKGKIDPTLILAIVAIESSFNPFAQSPVGAQGLMQVMTRVHDEKYSAFGGKLAAFDPLANLRVGAQILSEYLARADGNVELALKYYVGAANLPDDGGYAERVLAERGFLRAVADGQAVAWNVPNTRSNPQAQAPGLGSASASASPAPSSGAGTVAAAERRVGAGPAEPGTLMAPAIGAALATNLSAPAPAATGAATHPARAVAADKTTTPRAPAAVASAPLPGAPAAPGLVPVVAPAAAPAAPATAPGPTAATDTGNPRPRAEAAGDRIALASGTLR
jgi:hypothetical protein